MVRTLAAGGRAGQTLFFFNSHRRSPRESMIQCTPEFPGKI